MDTKNNVKESHEEPIVMGVQIDKKSSDIIGNSEEARNTLLDYLLLNQS